MQIIPTLDLPLNVEASGLPYTEVLDCFSDFYPKHGLHPLGGGYIGDYAGDYYTGY